MEFFSFYFHNLSNIAECIIAIAAFSRFFEKRNKFYLRAGIAVPLLLLSGYLFSQVIPLGSNRAMVKHVIYYFLLLIAFVSCYRNNIWTAFFCITNAFCIQNILYEAYKLILSYTPVRDYTMEGFILRIAICTVSFVILYLTCNRFQEHIREIKARNKLDFLFLFIGFLNLTVATYGKFKVLSYTGKSIELNRMAHAFILLFCTMIILLQLCIIRTKRSEREREMITQLLHLQGKSYEQQKHVIENINIKCHDLKHQLIRLKENMDKKEIRETLNLIELYDGALQTGNKALDLVLLEKGLQCHEQGIQITCLINGARLNFLTDPEIYSLFGNAIDNAIQATRKLNEEKRFISITESGHDDLINIRIENYYNDALQFDDGLPQTKGDPLEHGFGLKSMKAIAVCLYVKSS